MQIFPPPHLSNIIKHFLIIESDYPELMEHHFFPDGNSGMVFHYGDPFVQHPESFIYGQVNKFRRIQSVGKIGMLVLVFQPHGSHLLLGIPAIELSDEIRSLSDFWGAEARALEDQVLHAADNGERIEILENFLTKKLNHFLDPGSCDPKKSGADLYPSWPNPNLRIE